jgi:hypothetical protein
MQLDGIDAQAILIADIHRDGVYVRCAPLWRVCDGVSP